MSVMYRHFPAKTDLFREVTLVPLIGAIEEFADSWRSQRNEPWTSYRLAHEFLHDLYLNLVDHRDSLIALVSADGLDIDLVDELITAIDRLFDQVFLIGVYESERVGWYDREGLDLAVRQIAAMVFGTIAFDRWLFPPGRHEGPGQVSRQPQPAGAVGSVAPSAGRLRRIGTSTSHLRSTSSGLRASTSWLSTGAAR